MIYLFGKFRFSIIYLFGKFYLVIFVTEIQYLVDFER